jgi:hypothetical protein
MINNQRLKQLSLPFLFVGFAVFHLLKLDSELCSIIDYGFYPNLLNIELVVHSQPSDNLKFYQNLSLQIHVNSNTRTFGNLSQNTICPKIPLYQSSSHTQDRNHLGIRNGFRLVACGNGQFEMIPTLLFSTHNFINPFPTKKETCSPNQHLLSILHKTNTWHQSSEDEPFQKL